MTPLQYFRLLAPEFVSVNDATVDTWLSMAGSLANTSCLDAERAAMAQALYAAHMLYLTERQAAGGSAAQGAIVSEKEGDLQREYAHVRGSDSWLGQTGYGQQFMEVTRSCYGSAIMTRGPA